MVLTSIYEVFPANLGVVYLLAIPIFAWVLLNILSGSPLYDFPAVNGKQKYEVLLTNARRRFQTQAAALIKSGFSASKNAFCMITDNGPILVLSNKYAKELRNDDRLSLSKFTANEFHSKIPGFEPFNVATVEGQLMLNAIKQQLQQALDCLVVPLSAETSDALSKNWTDNPEWRELILKPSILQIVAQLSSKVFTGDDLCRNPEWHRITITYTTHVYEATQALFLWPKRLRPTIARFLPACQKLRTQIEQARAMISAVLAKRKSEKDAAGRLSDAIDWVEESCEGRPYDAAITQLLLSFAAIHSTADMMTQVLYDICGREELLSEMRQEIISVIQDQGWTRKGLFNLKLMDSVLKEKHAHRANIASFMSVSMGRVSEDTIHLSHGVTIPKGAAVMVSSDSMWDPNEYPEPHSFDGHRFLRLRQSPEQEKYAQLVSSTPNHMGFGYGKHACPGRFFAANEVKIALCHMLLKYDFRLTDNRPPHIVSLGFNLFTDPMAKISLRRRKEEIQLP
ncbi:Cytochrome P450 [Penicillium canariense]|uniref:Cytochrome P450 n=1 Tax=Penicillium canariense TaxID=189055 RepID=A0A9W9IGN6_9EURO|nr:Cytochrome P450 [Penicillium canariense]KAJ5175585.1 Cytochrome P450 [Penicillium canariense]